MKLLRLLLLALVCVSSQHALAQRLPIPVVNFENVLVERPGAAPATEAQVRQAIMAAATATGRQWMLSDGGPGRLVGTYNVRTHSVSVDIRYSALQFSVTYRDSVNMKYLPSEGGKIHPFYNQWVKDFVTAIRLQLQKAA